MEARGGGLITVRHQRSLDRTGGLNKGEFLAHRNVHRSGDSKPEHRRRLFRTSDAQALFGRGEDPDRSEGLRGEDSIAELCRREGIAQNLYYRCSKDFLEAGKQRLAGNTARDRQLKRLKQIACMLGRRRGHDDAQRIPRAAEEQ